MGELAFIAIFLGILTLIGLILWVRQHETGDGSTAVDPVVPRAQIEAQNSQSAVIVVTAHGTLVHMNALARDWVGANGMEPDLEEVAHQIQPVDHFWGLLGGEVQTSFQLGMRWVEATSHIVPAPDGNRVVVVMRELMAQEGSVRTATPMMDVSLAMSVINEVGEVVDASMGIELTLQVLLEILNKALPSDAGEICIWDERKEFLTQRGWIGDTRYLLTVAAQGGGYREGQGIPGWMVQHKRPIHINGKQDPVNLQVLMRNNPYGSAAGIPLVLGDEFVGSLVMYSSAQDRYSTQDVSLLQAISKAIATAIRNAELYARQEDRIRDIASLQQITEQPKGQEDATPIYRMLNERMAKLLDADMCGVLLYDESRQALLPQGAFHGLPEHVSERIIIPLPPDSSQNDIWLNQPYWVSNDVEDEPMIDAIGLTPIVSVAGIKNTALFPLQIAGERIGVMAISNKHGAGFLPADIQNLRVLASQAAIVVENVRLYQRERRIDTELVGLQEMTHAIGALSHEGEFYLEISERIARLMESEMCGVLLYEPARRALVSRLPFYGIDDEIVRDYVITIPQGSVMEQLWQDENFWYSNRVNSDTLVFEAGLDVMAERAGVTKTMMAVMSAGGRRMGVVQVSNKLNGADYDDKDARLLQIFATQASSIIENARLYREVQVRAEQADRLRRIAEQASSLISADESFEPLLSEIAGLTDSQIVAVSLMDRNGALLRTDPRWMYGSVLEDAVIQDISQRGYEVIPAQSGEMLILNHVEQDDQVLPAYRRALLKLGMHSAAIVPLLVGDRVIGELSVANKAGSYYESDLSVLGTVAAQIASAIERLLLYEETGENLRRRVEELDAISRISNQLTLTIELQTVLEVIREQAVRATYADNGTIVILRPEEDRVRPDVPEIDQRIGDIPGLVGLAQIERDAIQRVSEPVIVRDYAELTTDPVGGRSAAAVAVLYVDQVVGVIHITDNRPGAFDQRAAGFLMTLATKASLAYQNALLYRQQMERGERLRQRVDQLNRIFELGQMVQTNTPPDIVMEAIAFSVQQSVGFDTVLMMLFDEEDGLLHRVAQAGMPLDYFESTRAITVTRTEVEHLLNEQYRTSETYFFPVEQIEGWYTDAVRAVSASYSDNRSVEARGKTWWHDGDLLLVTIVGQYGEMLGLMALDRPYNNHRPERGTFEVLEIFAHQAATMVENTRLFRASQRSAEQESRLNDTMERIAGTLDLRDIAQQLAGGLRPLLPFDNLTLVLKNEQENVYDYLRVFFDDTDSAVVSATQKSELEETIVNNMFETREMHVFDYGDVSIPQFKDLLEWATHGEKSSALLPLNSGGMVLGVLHLGSDQPGAYAARDIRQLLTRTAQLVASTIQNARLFNQAVNLQILNRSVVESIQQGIVVLDNNAHIININEFMRQAYGWDDRARGQELFAYQPFMADFLREDLEAVLIQGEQREQFGQTQMDDAGEPIVRNFYLYPLRFREQIRGAVLLVEDVTERTRLEEAIEARANQLAALTEVSTRITASLERSEVVDLAMEEMGWIISFDTMTMWRRNGSYMVLDGFSGFDEPNKVPRDLRIRIADHDAVNQLVDSQRVVNISDLAQIPHFGLPGEEFTQSWMGVPLVNQGHVVGMFILNRDDPYMYDSRQEHNVAFAFASQVAIALANADLFEQTFERTNELGTLLEAAQATSLTRNLDDVFQIVADLMFNALEMENCTIMIWDEVEDELEVQFSGNRMEDVSRTVALGTRYMVSDYPARRKSLRDREVVVLIDVEDPQRAAPYPFELEEMRAAGEGARMIVPLVVRDQAIGIIQLDQASRAEDSISQQKVRLSRALGSQVAIAIENARLTAETTSRFEELLTINQLSQSISSTLKLEDMLPIIRDQVPQVTSAEEMYLALYNAEKQEITFPLAVRSNGQTFHIPNRPLGDDEVSYIIRKKHSLSLGALYFSIDELRRSMRITNGEGDVKAYMGVPLKSGDQVLGVLAIRNLVRTRAFTLNDDRILTTVGSQLGAAIQNARLFEQIQSAAENLNLLVQVRTEELEDERDRLDTLYQITSELARTLDMEQLLERSLSMVSKAVGADDGVIMLTDPATDNLYSRAWVDPNHVIYIEEDDLRTHPAEGLALWLIYNDDSADHVMVVPDLNEMEYWDDRGRATGMRSALAVMLENNEDPMGVMVLLSRTPGTFNDNHLKLLVPAATQVAAAINSADLYQLIRDQAERMGRLLRSEQEEAQKNSAILESIADGVMLANSKGQIILFNSAAERILEISREQAMDQTVMKLVGIYGQSGAKWLQLINEWSANPESASVALIEPINERLEIGSKIISAQLSPVYIGDLFLGTVSVFRDITRDVEADRAKAKFIENVSHEFRTPLTPIKGYTDLLLLTGADKFDDMQLQMVKTIKENTDRLAALVNDVLNISKLDSGEDKLIMSLVDLNEVIPLVVNKFSEQPAIQKKEIQTLLDVSADVPMIRADRDKLIQVISNVVDNAYNYTPANGKVSVRARRLKDIYAVQIEIADTGVGIPEEFREAAWRRFERFDHHALELEVAGTGLGLPLAKDLVRLHNGEIWFDSELGKGTTFYIRLPIEQPNYRTSTVELPRIDEPNTIAGD